MLTYSSRTSAALRAHLNGNSAFDHNDSRSPRVPALLSMESRFPQDGEEWHKQRARALCGHDTGDTINHAVEVFPSDAVARRTASWDGMAVEVIQPVALDTVEFRFRAPTHLLVAHEEGIRRDGETFVEGLPPSTLRDLRRRLTFVPAGHEYHERLEPRSPSRFTYFYFDPAKMPLPPAASPADTLLAPRLLFENNALWETAVKLAKLIEDGPKSRRYCEALGIVLAHELVRLDAGTRRADPPVRGGLAPWQQRIVTDYIAEHLAEPISLAELAQLVRLSPYHFCRAFKQSFGVPPHRYHSLRRIERAKSLLAKPACSVTEIGLTVGFSETSSFTAAFRKATGSTPTAYRRSLG
jgi:AraC family transcriptional regulator